MKRYNLGAGGPYECKDGSVVSFEDHQAELDTERARWQALNDAYLALKGEHEKLQWQPMETAPKDQPIEGWCVHEADPYFRENGNLTLYGAHVEGLSHVEDGPHVLVWGGAFDDRSYEEPNAAWLPDWWFLSGSEFEIAANPILWRPIPVPNSLPATPEASGESHE